MTSRPRDHRFRHHIAALLSTLVVAGLFSVVPGSVMAQDAGQGQQRIEGPRWQLLEYRDQAGDLELVPPGFSATALLWFEVISGQGACSDFRSAYTLQRDTLIIDEPEITLRGCDPEAQAIDDAFYRNLTEAASWTSDGSVMELRDPVGDVLMTFTEAQIPDDPTIAPWQLARLTGADGSTGPVLPGSEAAVQFLRGGRVVGTTGCGWFLGSYTTNDTLIDITDVASRQESCSADLRAQASRIINELDEVSEFEVLPAGLTLQDRSGEALMTLVPSIPLGDRTWTPIAVLDDAGESFIPPLRLRTSAVRFADDKADGRSVCRPYVAGSLRSGLALSVFDIDGPKARCRPKPRKGQDVSQLGVEEAFLDRLEMAASHSLRGSELELMDANGQPIMRLRPQPEFVGVPWVLDLMDVRPNAGLEVLRAPDGEEPLAATFESIGVMEGTTGKNGFIAFYETPRASTIEISEIEVDGKRCAGRRANFPLCVQEKAYLDLLRAADGYVVASDGLTLLKGSRRILVFVRADEATQQAETE